jgi:tripartite ATP-independent transporter DctP family solute receptor
MTIQKFAALSLACAMSASLAACGGSSSGTTTAAADSGASSAADSGVSSAADSKAASGSAASSDYSALDPVELIGADASSNGAAAQQLGELVAQKVDEITGGQLTIDYHPNSELGGDADILRQVYSGDIDIAVCQTAPVVSFIPQVAVFDLPMVFARSDGDTIDQVLNGDSSEFHQKLSEAYENSGFHLLGLLQNATFRLTTSNKELAELKDFKDLHIRTMENSNHMAFWSAIGASPTPLSWPEVYISLQNGTIDAEENAADTILGANLQEVQKYLSCTNHILYLNQISINKESYAKLDPAYQAALDQAVSEAIDEIRPKLATLDSDSKKKLQDNGMTMTEYDSSFYDEVLALDGVKQLYSDIDSQVNGLGTILQDELNK